MAKSTRSGPRAGAVPPSSISELLGSLGPQPTPTPTPTPDASRAGVDKPVSAAPEAPSTGELENPKHQPHELSPAPAEAGDAPPETPTVTSADADHDVGLRIGNLPPAEPYLPGFAMVDSAEDLPDPAGVGIPGHAAALSGRMANAPPQPPSIGPVAGALVLEAGQQGRPAVDIPDSDFFMPSRSPTSTPFGNVRYESRIRILEAYQYPGNLKGAPDWVDRNWVGYHSDYDPLRGIEPGPALRIPTRGGDEMVWCRPGDYVVKQAVTLMHGLEPDVVVEVWARESFEKNFLPALTAPSKELISEDGLRGSPGEDDQVLDGALSG